MKNFPTYGTPLGFTESPLSLMRPTSPRKTRAPLSLKADYYTLRSDLATTAVDLRQAGMRVAESFLTAYAIVGEDVADGPARRRLYAFFIGELVSKDSKPIRRPLFNGATVRAYAGLSDTQKLNRLPESTQPIGEPVANRLLQESQSYDPRDLSVREREEHAGALMRALASQSLGKCRPDNVNTVAHQLTPIIAHEVAVSLTASLHEFMSDYAPQATD